MRRSSNPHFVGAKLLLFLILSLISSARPSAASPAYRPPRPDYPAPTQSGFPLSLSGSGIAFAPPTLADLNGDGQAEIIIGTDDGWVHAVHPDGTIMWSHNTAPDFNALQPGCSGTEIRSAPAVADLNRDGSLEVVVGVGNIPQNHTHGGLIVLRASDGSVYPGWPYLTADVLGDLSGPDGCSDGIVTSPAVADLDGDGKLEIVAGSFDLRVYAWKLDGRLVPGWPRITQDTIWSSPAIADLDNDGWPEVVIGSDSHTDPYFSSHNGGALWVFRHDGAPLAGLPCYFDPSTPSNVNHAIQSSPAIADLDNDGWPDVVVGTGPEIGSSVTPPRLYAFSGYALTHASCSSLPGWPAATSNYVHTAPAIGDLEGNGAHDVVVTALDGQVYAWHANGVPLSGFPMRPLDYTGNAVSSNISSPVLADLDGDGKQDIFFSLAWEVGIVRSNGQQHTSSGPWPDPYRPSLVTNWSVNGIPAVGNVDTDNGLEIYIGGNGPNGVGAMLYGWQISTTHALNWPIFRQNPLHTAAFPVGSDSATVVSHTLPLIMAPGVSQAVSVTVKNTGTTTWTSGDYSLCAPQGNSFGGFACVALSRSVAPQDSITFSFSLTAPATQGYYADSWRMRHGSAGWFGDMSAPPGGRTRVGDQPALYVLTTDPNRTGTIVYTGGVAPDLGQPHDQGTPPCTSYAIYVAPQALQLTTDKQGYYIVFANDRVCWGGTAVDVGGTTWPISSGTIQDVAVPPGMTGMITLDADGTLRYAGIPPVSLATTAPQPCGAMQTARSLALSNDGNGLLGLYVMDARGCIYRGGSAPDLPQLNNAPLADGSAKKLKLAPGGTGYYILDQYGNVWPGGGAPAISPNYPIATTDWARDFELTADGTGYYLLAKDGSILTGGSAPALTLNVPPTWPGQDVARDLELADSSMLIGLEVPPPTSLALMRDPEHTSGDITLHLEGIGGQTYTWQANLTPPVNWLNLSARSGTTPADLVLIQSSNAPSCRSYPCTFSTTLNLAIQDSYGHETSYTSSITLYVVQQMKQVFLPLSAH